MAAPTTAALGVTAAIAVAALITVGLLYFRQRRRASLAQQRVQRRNAEIERLRQQLLDARRLEAVGILAGGIVNNLNNLLAAMLGSARLASQEQGLPARVRQELDRLLKAGHQAADVVRELGDFYRDADQARRPQDLLPVVRDTVKLLQDLVPSTVDVRAELRACGPVLATRAGVQQVIMNLASSAVGSLGTSGGRLTIRLLEHRVEAGSRAPVPALVPGAYAGLSVDIAPAERGGVALPPVSDGDQAALRSLLGDQGVLAFTAGTDGRRRCDIWFPLIAWRVATDHETAITSVPRVPAAAPVEPPEAELPAVNGAPRATILLVDDEEMVAQVLSRGLRRLGYRVVIHIDSRTALADFTQTPDLFDIVITDQIMPQMSGVRLAQRIHELRPDIPVALCTGFRDSFNEQQAREAGIADFVLKPTSHRALAAVVDRHVLKRLEGRG